MVLDHLTGSIGGLPLRQGMIALDQLETLWQEERMKDDPRLEGKCPKCNQPFFLAPADYSLDRGSYTCPHCGTEELMSHEMEKEALLHAERMAKKK